MRIAKNVPRRVATALIPDRVQLPLAFWWQSRRHALEPELLFVLMQGKKSGIAIDVGANEGLYSYALAKIFDRVEAFEPNQSAATKLSGHVSDVIALHHVALSRNESQASLYTPVSSYGAEYSGWGSLHREMLPPSDSVHTRAVSTRSLDSYSFSNVALIKIDVEGHEVDVLEGASNTIARCQPLVLIEVKIRSRRIVWDFFSARQYQCFWLANGELQPLKDAGGFIASKNENFFWIPEHAKACSSE